MATLSRMFVVQNVGLSSPGGSGVVDDVTGKYGGLREGPKAKTGAAADQGQWDRAVVARIGRLVDVVTLEPDVVFWNGAANRSRGGGRMNPNSLARHGTDALEHGHGRVGGLGCHDDLARPEIVEARSYVLGEKDIATWVERGLHGRTDSLGSRRRTDGLKALESGTRVRGLRVKMHRRGRQEAVELTRVVLQA